MIGDLVLSVNSDSGELEFSPIILFLDRDPNKAHQFFIIQTESGHSMTLTPWTFQRSYWSPSQCVWPQWFLVHLLRLENLIKQMKPGL